MTNKKECEECKKKFRSCKVQKAKDGRKLCTMCRKRLVTNPFYIPLQQKGKGYISKYSISDEEKSILYKKLIREGKNSQQAWKLINSRVNMLRRNRSKKSEERKGERLEKVKEKKVSSDFKKAFKKLGETQ